MLTLFAEVFLDVAMSNRIGKNQGGQFSLD